jgi:hypothetical protein
MQFEEGACVGWHTGCSPSAHENPELLAFPASMCVDDPNVQGYFNDRSPAPDNSAQAAVAAFPAAAQPTQTPNHIAQVSQPHVTPKEILKLKIEMKALAQLIASFNSEPFEKFLISEDELGSLDELADKKEILEQQIAALQRVLDRKTAPAAPPQAQQETAPLQAKQETSSRASYSSTYAATVRHVQPNQWQTQTNYCEQIPDRKIRKQKLSTTVSSSPKADAAVSPAEPAEDPVEAAAETAELLSSLSTSLPFRPLTKEDIIQHCLPPECKQRVDSRRTSQKEKEGHETWRIHPVEFLSWCCHYIRWAKTQQKWRSISGTVLYREFTLVYGERGRGCSRMIGINPCANLFTIQEVMIAAQRAWGNEITDECVRKLLCKQHKNLDFQQENRREQQSGDIDSNRSSNDDDGSSNEAVGGSGVAKRQRTVTVASAGVAAAATSRRQRRARRSGRRRVFKTCTGFTIDWYSRG